MEHCAATTTDCILGIIIQVPTLNPATITDFAAATTRPRSIAKQYCVPTIQTVFHTTLCQCTTAWCPGAAMQTLQMSQPCQTVAMCSQSKAPWGKPLRVGAADLVLLLLLSKLRTICPKHSVCAHYRTTLSKPLNVSAADLVLLLLGKDFSIARLVPDATEVKPGLKLRQVGKDVWQQEVEQTPKLAQVILQWCTCTPCLRFEP